jgi:hypothetical protein
LRRHGGGVGLGGELKRKDGSGDGREIGLGPCGAGFMRMFVELEVEPRRGLIIWFRKIMLNMKMP